jgi:NDP-sugar pyrophosphorylase family protein
MNIVFPIAGFGTRFSDKGYKTFKPFIKIKNVAIIEMAMKSLSLPGKYHVISRDLSKEYETQLLEIFDRCQIDGKIHYIEKPTSGASETCLHAETFLDPTEPLLITNCDQYTPWNYEKFIAKTREDIDAIVTTYDHGGIVLNDKSPYSFVSLDQRGLAERFAEKHAISLNALNGIHYWKRAEYFFDSAKELLGDKSIEQEKYISLTFNYMIRKGYRIGTHHMEKEEFYALGTPDEVQKNLPFI